MVQIKKQAFLNNSIDRNDPALREIIRKVRASNEIDFYGKQSLISLLNQLSIDEILELKNLLSGLIPGGIIYIISKYFLNKGLGSSVILGILGTVVGSTISSLSQTPKNKFKQKFLTTHNNFGKKYFIG